MEDSDNIVLMCEECTDKRFPNKGRLDIEVGEFAKLKFESEFGSEYMWVNVTKIDREKGIYEGTLDSYPVLVNNINCGDKVEFRKEDILEVYK